MKAIRVITNKDELEGTGYIEVLPGSYKNQCWNEGSLFFEEEVFGYLEPLIERHEPTYDHYAFTEIEKKQWVAIADDLDALHSLLTSRVEVAELQNHIGFIFKGTAEHFAENFEPNKAALALLIAEFSGWIRAKLKEHSAMTILGM